MTNENTRTMFTTTISNKNKTKQNKTKQKATKPKQNRIRMKTKTKTDLPLFFVELFIQSIWMRIYFVQNLRITTRVHTHYKDENHILCDYI